MANCQNVGKFADILEKNIDWLRKNGHPKWNSVDLDYPLKGWEQYDCVKKYAGKSKRLIKQNMTNEVNPVLEAMKDIL
jgi:hypothetical protein